MTRSTDLVIGMHHPGLVVADLERAVDFYTRVFGYQVFSTNSWSSDNSIFNQIVGLEGSAARLCMLKGKNIYLELFEYETPQADAQKSEAFMPGIRHISFLVSDVEAMLKLCVSHGGEEINQPVTVEGKATAIYCRDPFGNLIELVESLGGFPKLPVH